MTRIAHILGGWSVNIGNAFFQLAGYHVLRDCLPEAEVMLVPEQPGYPSYWTRKVGHPGHSLDYVNLLAPDYLVLMGPIFRREIFTIWGDALERLMLAGTRLALLGVGAMTYTDPDIQLYREFLSRFRPALMVTRDSDTYHLLGDLAECACDGIDFSFFLSDYYPLPKIEAFANTVALNFDKIPEPRILVNSSSTAHGASFEFGGQRWQLDFPRFRTWLARSSRYGMFLEGAVFGGNEVEKIGGFDVLRLDHRPHPLLRAKTYRSPRTLVNDTPYPYLDVYGNAALTLTDRVHAAAAALQYGKPAMLFSSSPRVRMLDRLGLEEIGERPVRLDKERLREEKGKIKSFIEANKKKLIQQVRSM